MASALRRRGRPRVVAILDPGPGNLRQKLNFGTRDQARLHPLDRWYWVALRYDGTTMSHFVSGIKELEGPVAFPPMDAAGQVSLGVRLNKVNWFKGQIKEVRITPRALPEEALQKEP